MARLLPSVFAVVVVLGATTGFVSPVFAQGNVPSKGGDPGAAAPAPAEGGEAAPGQQPQGEPPGMGNMFVVMGLIFLFFWIFFIRPQNKQIKEHDNLVKGLKNGDNVVTQGGMFGTIVGFDDSTASVLLEIAKGTRVRVVRNQISRLQKQAGADQGKK